jgi:hypothetical protein
MAAHLAHHGIERHELVHGRQALRLGGRGRLLGRRAPLWRAPQREQAGQQPERRVSLPLPPRVQLSAQGSPQPAVSYPAADLLARHGASARPLGEAAPAGRP